MNRLLLMEAFVRVVDAGSFTAGARRMGCSKAAASKYVAELEAHLGVTLLRRTTRSLSLTDAGRSYHVRCVELLDAVDQLETSVRDDHQRPRGRLSVTAPPGFMASFTRRVTTEFVARYPDIEMTVQLTHRMVDLVHEGIDVAIRVTDPRDSSLVARKLAPAPIVAVAAPDYLRRRGVPAAPRELTEHDCLVDSNFRDGARWRFRGGRRDQVVEVGDRFRVNSPIVVRDLAIAGHGVALVPAFVADEALADGRLVEVLSGRVALSWSIYALYPRRRHLPGRVRVFVDHLVESFAASP